MKYIRYILLSIFLFSETVILAEETKRSFNPKEAIFEHLGDAYEWKTWNWTISLPVIVIDQERKWHVFCSARLKDGMEYEGFYLASGGDYTGKIVGKDTVGDEYRPWDLSITKNVLALLICTIVLCWILFPLVHWYKKHPYKAPRRVKGMVEFIVEMLYKDVIVSVLGKDATRYSSYLLTAFFFILTANLMGLLVVFPGGANLMGNISITLVLALCTFVVVNVSGKRKYWRGIFWSDVPWGLKCPVPMMPVIELLGIFTKPVALMIRLFANMMGGHLITLVLISLIFMFSAMGQAVVGTTTVLAVLFAVFMGILDLLICFIQAYVFMMLSTIFISLAKAGEEE